MYYGSDTGQRLSSQQGAERMATQLCWSGTTPGQDDNELRRHPMRGYRVAQGALWPSIAVEPPLPAPGRQRWVALNCHLMA